MKKILSLLFLLISLSSYAQFLDKAEYTGYLKLIPAYQNKDSIQLKLTVNKLNDSVWTWKSVFEGGIIKDYQILKKQDGSFELDEKNGIIISGTKNEHLLSFHYFVDERFYTVIYDLSNLSKTLSYTLIFGTKGAGSQSGSFNISSFKIEGQQFGTFARVKK